jgi:DNA-binding response OmpR family regulator
MMTAQLSQPARPVLLVEGNPPQERQLSNILEAHGYRVSSAPNGRMALEMARREKPGLVVCDASMPDMNGHELCNRIKADARLADVPVILMTTPSDPQEFMRGLECRADQFVLKPCDAGQLVRRIQDLMADGDGRAAAPPGQQLLGLLLSAYQAATQRIRDLEGSETPRPSPAAQPAASTTPSQTSASGRHALPPFAPRSLRVLLIDDDPALLESLRSTLQDEGHRAHTTTGGRAGIEAFRDAQRAGKMFDVVITDLRMPYVDGHEVVASVRAMSPGTPIIVLTGWGHSGLSGEPPLQVDRVLGKPPRIRELRAALAELTGRRATDRPTPAPSD